MYGPSLQSKVSRFESLLWYMSFAVSSWGAKIITAATTAKDAQNTRWMTGAMLFLPTTKETENPMKRESMTVRVCVR